MGPDEIEETIIETTCRECGKLVQIRVKYREVRVTHAGCLRPVIRLTGEPPDTPRQAPIEGGR